MDPRLAPHHKALTGILAQSEVQRQKALATADQHMALALAAEEKARKEIERLAPLVDDPDPDTRQKNRAAYLQAVHNKARAGQVYALAEADKRKLEAMGGPRPSIPVRKPANRR